MFFMTITVVGPRAEPWRSSLQMSAIGRFWITRDVTKQRRKGSGPDWTSREANVVSSVHSAAPRESKYRILFKKKKKKKPIGLQKSDDRRTVI